MRGVNPHDSCAVLLYAATDRPQCTSNALKRAYGAWPVALRAINSSKLIFMSAQEDRAIFRALHRRILSGSRLYVATTLASLFRPSLSRARFRGIELLTAIAIAVCFGWV